MINEVRAAPVTFDALTCAVARLLGVEPGSVGRHDDLVVLGIDSIGVMSLVNEWRQWGVDVTFGQLMEYPTLDDWWSQLVPAAKPAPVAAVDTTAELPLSDMQRAYWAGRSEALALGGNASHFYFEFDADGVDPVRLDAAVRRVAERHPMLRAAFESDGTQRIAALHPGLAEVLDLSAHTEVSTALEQRRAELSHQRRDPASGAVLDVRLTLLPDGRTRVHLDIDMMASDAASFRVLLVDLARSYLEPDQELPPIGLGYADYLRLRDEWRASRSAEVERARKHWADRVATLPGGPDLPLAPGADALRRPRNRNRHAWLEPELRDCLAKRSRERGVTLSLALVTAFAEVVARWSGERRFLLNMPFFDREPVHSDVAALVGDFTNLLLLEADLTEDEPFGKRARRVQQRFRADIAQAAYPGTSVLRDVARARGGAGGLAPVVFTSALSLGELFPPQVRDALGEPVWMSSETAQVALDVQVVEQDGGVLVNWEGAEGWFRSDVLDDMFDAYVARLRSLADPAMSWDEQGPVELPVHQAEARRMANATDAELPVGTLHGEFFRRAKAEPDRVAVVDVDGTGIGYGELADRALRVAACLRDRGVRIGDTVVVHLPRGAGQVVAVLGVLAAGCTYVPVGTHQPAPRRERIHQRAGTRVAIVAEPDAPEKALDLAPIVLAEAVSYPERAEPVEAGLAYVIFTSGSTGEPKGVEVSHRAAGNTIRAIIERFDLRAEDRTLAVSALDFDLSVFDLFAPLSLGGAIVCVPEEARRDARQWLALCLEHQVTVLNCVPALLDMLLVATTDEAATLGLRTVILGGDRVGVDLPGRLRAVAPQCRFAGLGGTTETAIHSTVYEVDGEVPADVACVPYGAPLANQLCRVVDPNGLDCPDWVAGELWIGGASVAEGYRGDPALTADRFVEHEGKRWYRTGDLAKYRTGDVVEFLGRSDFQIKIDGFRVEPGEVEAVLTAFPGVTAAAVVAVVAAGSKRLAALVIASEDVRPDDVLDFAAERLPAYLVPDRISVVDTLPLSSNGKVDRTQVGQLLAASPAKAGRVEPPRGEIETTVAELWADLLGLPRVNRTDSFFAIGGDSLQATRLLGALAAAGLHGADLLALFNKPLLADFAATLSVGEKEVRTALVPDPEHRHDPFPATDVQRAYWMGRSAEFALGGVGSHWYWEFDGRDVDLGRLERAWNRLVRRHDMMRAVFTADGTQHVLPEVPDFRVHVANPDPADENAALAALRERMAHRLFDVTQWPLFDLAAVRHGGDRTRLAFGFDYIVLDAMSIMIIFDELSALYRDESTELPAVELSFRDYVLRGGIGAEDPRRKADEEYWSGVLAQLPPAPALPLAVEPEQVTAPKFSRREFFVSGESWNTLLGNAREHGLTPSAVLAAAFADTLSSFGSGKPLTITLTLFDRRDVHPDVNNIVGDFTSLLLVGHRPEAGRGWVDAVRAVQEQIWSGLAHGSVSAIWVLRELARASGAAEVLMPAVFTSTLGVSGRLSAGLDTPFGEHVHGLSQTPQVYLDCQVVERAEGISVNWDAVDEVFPAGLLDTMFDAYRRLVEWAATADWTAAVPSAAPAEQLRARADVNNVTRPISGNLLHQRFFELAAAEPDRVALIDPKGGEVSYGDLAHSALSVGGWLKSHGVAARQPVGVNLPKGVDQIVAVLGVLAAGGCYVPIGVDQPPARRARIVARAGVDVVLSDLTEPLAHKPLVAPESSADTDLAYVIFTSGSTGEPKGVEITHRSAVNTIEDIDERFAVGPDDRALAVSALDFDLSVYDIFGLLSVGGAVVLICEEDRREARTWRDRVQAHGVTVWNTVPALLDMVLTVSDAGQLDGLRLALASGDWVAPTLPGRFAAAAPHAKFVALGGATEGAIWSNAMEVGEVDPGWRSVPYGYPLANQRYRVVDELGRDCPDLVPGELWIGGDGVAQGYRGDAELTAQRFLAHDGHRWYRTGDLGRYHPGAVIEFLGRVDHQVKIRGHRVELGEIESGLTEHPEVSGAVVVVAAGRLVAFVTTTTDRDFLPELADLLAERLPGYMIPERIEPVQAFPLSANGKVDRAALVERASHASAAGSEAPQGELETSVAAMWADLLEVPAIGRHDSVFALGADSLMATRATEILRTRFGVELSLRGVFDAPTVAALAALVERTRQDSPDVEEGVL